MLTVTKSKAKKFRSQHEPAPYRDQHAPGPDFDRGSITGRTTESPESLMHWHALGMPTGAFSNPDRFIHALALPSARTAHHHHKTHIDNAQMVCSNAS